MATTRLTDNFVKSVAPTANRQMEYRDASITGFILRVSPGGRKTFYAWYRVHGRARRMSIGSYPLVTLAQARERARVVLSQAQLGIDPLIEKHKLRATKDDRTFAVLREQFIDHLKYRGLGWKEPHRIVSSDFGVVWDTWPIEDISKADIQKRVALVQARGPSAAHNAHTTIRRFFNWTVSAGHLERSPASGLKSLTKARSRTRTLDESEIVQVWNAAEQIEYPFGVIVRMLFLTGCRRNEVVGLQWREIDIEKAEWLLPASRSKNRRAHLVPLSQRALSLLNSIPRVHDSFVFPSLRGNTPLSGFAKRKLELQALSNTANWTLHDIRRTVATGLARLRYPTPVIEKILNHSSGAFASVAGIYNQYDYESEKREALSAWAEYIATLINARQTSGSLPTRDQ